MKHEQREHVMVWAIFITTLVVMLLNGCVGTGTSPVGDFFTRTLHLDGLTQFLWGALTAVVIGVIAGVPAVTALLIGVSAVAVTKATEPAAAATTVVNNNGKGKINMNAPPVSSGFLGISTFWWGVVAVAVVLFVLRNRVHLTALATRQVPKGERLRTVLRMLVGRAVHPPKAPGQ